jgi:hypothetical protein
VPDLAILRPSPDDPNLFTGQATFVHAEMSLPGGQDVQDVTVTWSIRRMP